MFPQIFFSMSAHQISCVQEKISCLQHISQKCFLTSHEKFPLYPTKISHDFFLFLVIDHFLAIFTFSARKIDTFSPNCLQKYLFLSFLQCVQKHLKETFLCATTFLLCACLTTCVRTHTHTA